MLFTRTDTLKNYKANLFCKSPVTDSLHICCQTCLSAMEHTRYSIKHIWPSGLRRQTQDLLGVTPREFESHSVHSFYEIFNSVNTNEYKNTKIV